MQELIEAIRIASAQVAAHKLRSLLTALGVIIGIVAVTLMGTAISGMNTAFDKSLAMLGDDLLYVQKWPWHDVEDWWNYVDRPPLRPRDAARLNQLIADTPNSKLDIAVPVMGRSQTVKRGDKEVDGVYTMGSTGDYGRILTADLDSGRLFTNEEAEAGRPVCILGYDVAHALFPGERPLDRVVTVHDHPFRVLGVMSRQGSLLGLFSFDNMVLLPLGAFRKYVNNNDRFTELRVRVKDKHELRAAEDELTGDMRRIRGQGPAERDNFSINEQQAFKQQLDPVERGIALAGLFVTGLALFVGAIGIMNITFVSVKERTREIGTRRALGATRRTILLQFLIEAAAISLVGGAVGLVLTWTLVTAVGLAMPQLPVVFSPVLAVVGILVSVSTGLLAGFAPAWSASRLDPVEALRYE